MGKLNGKVAVVTGGSSGIGLAIAQRFVAEGAYVFIVGRRQAALDAAKAAIGKNITTVKGDVSNLADLDRLFKTIKTEKGSLDIIVTSAGVLEVGTVDSTSPEQFDKCFNLNARGTFFTVQKALPIMRKGGSIVLVSSAASQVGVPGYSAYSATKAAVRSFARTWTMELKDRGIRVNTLSPGPIETPMLNDQWSNKKEVDEGKAMFISMTPLGRIGRPEEIASAALFLASDESSFCAGIDLVADGGISQV
jgi:NAD(P)-dependent dehydrogenase (short-subunit alcohol dehydrogenase family)